MIDEKFVNQNDIPYINEITVAVIMDPFTYNSFNYEFNTVVLEPSNWLTKFKENDIDLLFVESAWHGISDKCIVNGVAVEKVDQPWNGKVHTNLNSDEENRGDLFDIIRYCNENKIPTVFWNKEDPTSFDDERFNFVDTALYFDYIFTTDEDIIPRYNAKGHDKVYSLLFASQLSLYNPIEEKKRSNDIIFAGSWYNQFAERSEKMRLIFDKILDSSLNLKIYNRESGSYDPNRQYPEKYQEYVNPRVPLDKMPSTYKESKYALNINTVTGSHTMFARRVYELMSSNTFVFSNYSVGIDDLFKNRVIFLDEIDSLEIDEEEINKIRETNLYEVLENHNYYQRFKHILDIIGFKYKEHAKNVSIFYEYDENIKLSDIIEDCNSINYYYKTCYIISDHKESSELIGLDENKFKFIPIIHLPYMEEILDENDYFLVRDLSSSLDKDFVKKSLLHYQYLDKSFGIKEEKGRYENKFFIAESEDYKNIMFNNYKLNEVTKKINEFEDNNKYFKVLKI